MKRIAVVVAAATLGFAATIPLALADEAKAKAAGCLSCHNVSGAKKVGPSFKDIAAKKKDAKVEDEVKKLKEGKGHPAVKAKDEDLNAIVKWVLSL